MRLKPPGVLGIATVMLACLAGCVKSLPAAPSELLTGIVVYHDVNFEGDSAHVTQDISDLRDVRGPCPYTDWVSSTTATATGYGWSDCISSVRVAPGWQAVLYRDDGYRDDSVEIIADVADLTEMMHDCPHHGLNDCVTSIRVRRQ
jgi:hypothetical protein